MNRGALLLIAYHFPPDNAIGGARPFRFYKYLKRLGYECHVVTAARQTAVSADIEYVPDPLGIRPKQGLAWQAERICQKFLLHGNLALAWSQAARRAGQRFLDTIKAERIVILSSAPPLGTHLAAWQLARGSGRPWIADFRDPLHARSGPRALLQDFIGPQAERSILQNASIVLANTDSMRAVWGDDPKIHVIWNGFDPEDAIPQHALPDHPQKILSHVGELYGGRDIRPILHAVARLRESGMISPNALKVLQVGYTEPSELPEKSFLTEAQQAGWLELRETVPAAEARGIALHSDGLLLIQPHTALQVPGKLFDYLRTGRPILAYVVRGSPAEWILERSGVPYDCIYPEERNGEVERRLLTFLGKLNGQPTPPGAWFRETFDASVQTAALDRLIQSFFGRD